MTMTTIHPNVSLTRTLIRHPGSGMHIALPTPFAMAGGGIGDRIVHDGSDDNGSGGNAVGGVINVGGASLLH